jgi:hypothetical protein
LNHFDAFTDPDLGAVTAPPNPLHDLLEHLNLLKALVRQTKVTGRHHVQKERDLRRGAHRENVAILHPLIRPSGDTFIGFLLSGRLQQIFVGQSTVAGIELILLLCLLDRRVDKRLLFSR